MAIDVRMKDLITLARAAAEPYEPTPHSHWLRMEGAGRVVYVVRDAWADSCSVITLDERGATSIERFSRRYDAVAHALSLTSRYGAVPSGQRTQSGNVLPLYPPAGA